MPRWVILLFSLQSSLVLNFQSGLNFDLGKKKQIILGKKRGGINACSKLWSMSRMTPASKFQKPKCYDWQPTGGQLCWLEASVMEIMMQRIFVRSQRVFLLDISLIAEKVVFFLSVLLVGFKSEVCNFLENNVSAVLKGVFEALSLSTSDRFLPFEARKSFFFVAMLIFS